MYIDAMGFIGIERDFFVGDALGEHALLSLKLELDWRRLGLNVPWLRLTKRDLQTLGLGELHGTGSGTSRNPDIDSRDNLR